MEQHALAILQQQNRWDLPVTKRSLESGDSTKWEIVTAKLLYHLIVESQELGGTVLNVFWEQLGNCDERLKENIKSLKEEDFVSADRSFQVLFHEIDPKNVDFSPVVKMAADYFTHLGVALMNPGGKKSGTRTEHSVSETVSKDTDNLLEEVNNDIKKKKKKKKKEVNKEGDFWKRRQAHLKNLAIQRDGEFCLLTGAQFAPFDEEGVYPALAHIIPHSVHGKTDTLNCIAMFAGDTTRNELMRNLNTIGNVMNMERNAHESYDKLKWGIKAKEEGGEVKYFFRKVPTNPYSRRTGYIILDEGDEIQFGQGREGKQLNKGPLASLCNLQLAAARVMKMSGAADIISQWQHEADDDDCYCSVVASEEHCSILDAKLLLSGRAVLV